MANATKSNGVTATNTNTLNAKLYGKNDKGKPSSWICDVPESGITPADIAMLYGLGVLGIGMYRDEKNATEGNRKARILYRNGAKEAVEAFLATK